MQLSEKLISKNKLTNLTMLDIIKMSSKGQVVIPEAIRKKLKLKVGSRLVIRRKGRGFYIEPEESFMKLMSEFEEKKEDLGWMMIAQESMKDIWDNPEDEEEWKKYL